MVSLLKKVVCKICTFQILTNQLLTNCKQLKLMAADGKRYSTDVANSEQLLRIIQSIPSPKAEPIKMWLAQVGKERIDESADPEIAIDRAFQTYLRDGYSDKHSPLPLG